MIPESGDNFSIDTNNVNSITIVNALQVLQQIFSQKLVKEAEKAVGPSLKAQEEYLDKLIAENKKREMKFRVDGNNMNEFDISEN